MTGVVTAGVGDPLGAAALLGVTTGGAERGAGVGTGVGPGPGSGRCS